MRPGQIGALRLVDELLQVFDNFVGELGLAVEHGQRDAGDLELRVDLLVHQLDGLEKLADALQRQEMRLHRDDHVGGGRQSVDGEQAQARRTVQQDEIEIVFGCGQAIAQQCFTAGNIDQFDFHGRQIDRRGHERNTLVEALHCFEERSILDQHGVERLLGGGRLDAIVDGEMGLRVHVDQADALARLGEGCAEIGGGRGLANATFLIHDCDNSHLRKLRFSCLPALPRQAAAGLRAIVPVWLGEHKRRRGKEGEAKKERSSHRGRGAFL